MSSQYHVPQASYVPPSYPPPPVAGPSRNSGTRAGVVQGYDADGKEDQTYYPLSDAPPSYRVGRLRGPVALPRTPSGAFVRAWPQELQNVAITQQEMLDFIDGLNQAGRKSAPLAIAGMVAGITGFIPSAIAQTVSMGVQIGAKIGQKVMDSGLSSNYIKRANDNYMRHRGVFVAICTTETLAMLCGRWPSQEMANNPSRPWPITIWMDAGLIAPVNLHDNALPEANQGSQLDQLGTWMQESQAKLGRRKAERNQAKYDAKEQELYAKAQEKPRKYQKELAKLEKKREKDIKKNGLPTNEHVASASSSWLVIVDLELAQRAGL